MGGQTKRKMAPIRRVCSNREKGVAVVGWCGFEGRGRLKRARERVGCRSEVGEAGIVGSQAYRRESGRRGRVLRSDTVFSDVIPAYFLFILIKYDGERLMDVNRAS